MENYTKYKLKAEDELAEALAGADNLFVIACNKCFKATLLWLQRLLQQKLITIAKHYAIYYLGYKVLRAR
mgnify:CR=1 FL=1